MITEDKNEFVRIKDFADVKVRVPNPDDDYLRPINYICNEESIVKNNDSQKFDSFKFGKDVDDTTVKCFAHFVWPK